MTTREQLEAEAEELYPLDRWQRMFNGEPFPRPEQDAHIRDKTITAEQVDAALIAWFRAAPEAGTSATVSDRIWERNRSRMVAAFRAAGFRIEGDET